MATQRRKPRARLQSENENQHSIPPPASASNSDSTPPVRYAKSKDASATIPQPAMNKLLAGQPVWVGLAIASGACAAINGVFAKLTTTSLTSNFSSYISTLLGLAADNNFINVLLRGTFFGLNLLFNGIMWGLFTAALTKGSSTTRVSIVNVSANFFLTAILGWLIFSEKLPLQWWMGAALLACGNVVIGRREEGEKPGGTVGLDQTAGDAEQREGLLGAASSGSDAQDLLELDESPEGSRKGSREEARRLERGNVIDDPI